MGREPKTEAKILTFTDALNAWPLILNLATINIAYPLVDMAAWHRIAAAKDISSGRKGFGTGIVAFLISWSAVMWSAIVISQVVGKGGAMGLVGGLMEFATESLLSGVIAGVALGCLFAALLSAGDIFLIVATQALCNDGPKIITGNATQHEAARLGRARWIVFALAIFSLGIIATLKAAGANVADLVFVLYGSSTALVPSVLFILLRKDQAVHRYALAAIISTVVGVTTGWLYGILAIAKPDESRPLLMWLDFLPRDPMPFNASFTALAWASVTFVIVGLFLYLRGSDKRASGAHG